MSSLRERIIQAAVTALNTDRPSGVPEFVRTRLESPTAEQLPAATVYAKKEETDRMRPVREGRTSRGPIVKRTLQLHIESLTAHVGSDTPDALADPILCWAVQAIGNAGTFSGLANDPADEEETTFEYEQADHSFCRATLVFAIEFQSKRSDATTRT